MKIMSAVRHWFNGHRDPGGTSGKCRAMPDRLRAQASACAQAGEAAAARALLDAADEIERLHHVTRWTAGSRAVYLGNNRVLCRLHLPERFDPDVIYIVDGMELTFVPRFIMD